MKKLRILLFMTGLLVVFAFKGRNNQFPLLIEGSDSLSIEKRLNSKTRSLDLLVIPGPNTDIAQVRLDFMNRLLSDFNGWQTCNWKEEYGENWSISWMSFDDLLRIARSLGYNIQVVDTDVITSTDDTQPTSGGASNDVRIIYNYNCDMN